MEFRGTEAGKTDKEDEIFSVCFLHVNLCACFQKDVRIRGGLLESNGPRDKRKISYRID